MLEAPEARLYARQLAETLTGKSIETVLIGFTPHKFAFFNKPAEYFEKTLTGKTVTGAESAGGIVELKSGNVSVVFTDGVNLRYIEPGADLPKTHQALFGFTDQSCLTASVRMYGGITCFTDGKPEGNLSDYYLTARTKPQVLSDDFTQEYFLSLATSSDVANKTAKAFLATEQRIPGLGNGVLQDILFNAGINPKSKIYKLDEKAFKKLYIAIKGTLSRMLEQGGRECETDIFGNKGGYTAILSKDTAGKACRKCGCVIIKESYMGGSIYYCPVCQPLI